MKRKIAVIGGGYSSERDVSLGSMRGICDILDREKFEVYPVIIDVDGWSVEVGGGELLAVDRNFFGFTLEGERTKFDFAWITIHGTPGENGLLQGYLEMLGVPYSGCGVFTSALTFNKYYCKRYLANVGVVTPKAILVRRGELPDNLYVENYLGYPVFVKPNGGGSSLGITKVDRSEDLGVAFSRAFAEGGDVIVESMVSGIEITCGCYKTDVVRTLPLTEVVSYGEFFDYDAKYGGRGAEEITPAVLSDLLAESIRTTTVGIYNLIRARGIIRVDYIVAGDGRVSMLEVNTTPGMTEKSIIPQQLRAAGIDATEFFTELIELSSN
ncbi:MAG: D-alanine--D-alanine ligase [Dysgonamonadaceae bacterium]|jgi:D-alanine-D-alanine ligase|nr:D-alanine--D-alanine ligase [Dysgonamonadaceae bacterium]